MINRWGWFWWILRFKMMRILKNLKVRNLCSVWVAVALILQDRVKTHVFIMESSPFFQDTKQLLIWTHTGHILSQIFSVFIVKRIYFLGTDSDSSQPCWQWHENSSNSWVHRSLSLSLTHTHTHSHSHTLGMLIRHVHCVCVCVCVSQTYLFPCCCKWSTVLLQVGKRRERERERGGGTTRNKKTAAALTAVSMGRLLTWQSAPPRPTFQTPFPLSLALTC